MHGNLYLEVPYSEKELAKSMGAHWDPVIKKWFYEGPVSNYVKLARWISGERELTIIAHEYIYISWRECRLASVAESPHVSSALELENIQDYTATTTAALKVKPLKIWLDTSHYFFRG